MSNDLPPGGKPPSQWAKPSTGIPATFGKPLPGGGYQAGSATPPNIRGVVYPPTPEQLADAREQTRRWHEHCAKSTRGEDMRKWYAERLGAGVPPDWFERCQ